MQGLMLPLETSPGSNVNHSPSSPTGSPVAGPRERIARPVAIAAAGLLAIALIWQLVSAGAAVFVNPDWWAFHTAAVHWFDWLSLVILVLAFAGRMSRRFKLLAAASVLLVFLQYGTAGIRTSLSLGAAAALHPLIGFLLFWTLTELLRRGALELKR